MSAGTILSNEMTKVSEAIKKMTDEEVEVLSQKYFSEKQITDGNVVKRLMGILSDNQVDPAQVATRWAVHGMVTTANKSVRMNYHWVQEAVKDGFVDPRRVATKDNTSDVFTKTLGTDDINRLRPGLTGYGPLPVIPESMPT